MPSQQRPQPSRADHSRPPTGTAPTQPGGALRYPGAPPASVLHLDLPTDVATLDRLRGQLAARGARVVLTNGCFDLIHVGHVRYLQAARRLGDFLFVGINADVSVRELKGGGRPVTPELERAEIIAAFACVDQVVIFSEVTARRLVEFVRPAIYAKGADYGPGRTILPEADLVAELGGRVEYVSLVGGRSTTALLAALADGGRTPQTTTLAGIPRASGHGAPSPEVTSDGRK